MMSLKTASVHILFPLAAIKSNKEAGLTVQSGCVYFSPLYFSFMSLVYF